MKKTDSLSPRDFFDYLVSKSNLDTKQQQQKFIDMHIEEIKRRTQMLQELNYDKRHIKKRIKQNIRWEFDTLGLPEFYNLVDRIVDQTYKPK
jgi:hypothetical protein